MSSPTHTFARATTLGTLLFLTACAEPAADRDREVDRGTSPSTAQLDVRRFVQEAASGGAFEVQSSQLALQRDVDQQTRDIAQRMIDDHRRANERLKELARTQGITVPEAMSTKHRQQIEQLERHQGEEFTRAYLDQQIAAHREAVQLFEQAQRSLPAGPLREFANETLPTLRQHLEHVRMAAAPAGR